MIYLGAVFAILGIIFLISAINEKRKCTSVTEGKVIDIREEVRYVENDRYNDRHHNDGGVHIHLGGNGYSSHRKEITYYPIYEYTVDGKIYKQQSRTGSSHCNFCIGQEVEIFYNPQRPQQFYTQSSSNSKMVAVVLFIIVGVGMMILSKTVM